MTPQERNAWRKRNWSAERWAEYQAREKRRDAEYRARADANWKRQVQAGEVRPQSTNVREAIATWRGY